MSKKGEKREFKERKEGRLELQERENLTQEKGKGKNPKVDCFIAGLEITASRGKKNENYHKGRGQEYPEIMRLASLHEVKLYLKKKVLRRYSKVQKELAICTKGNKQ